MMHLHNLKGLTAFTVALAALTSAATSDAQTERKSMMEHAEERKSSEKYLDIHGRHGNGPGAGTMAPDFALTPLKFYELGIDDTRITEETAGMLYDAVRLSDFRGKKPVVLIFGSYT